VETPSSAGKPSVWSLQQIPNLRSFTSNYDIAPEGNRFRVLLLLSAGSADDAKPNVTILLNFINELRRRIP
jgi:hypothetical protein